MTIRSVLLTHFPLQDYSGDVQVHGFCPHALPQCRHGPGTSWVDDGVTLGGTGSWKWDSLLQKRKGSLPWASGDNQ